MPKVSIIIPVYKAERTIERCLQSIIAQTYSDWESICINDGSPDCSVRILEQYALRDNRIKVYSKPNGGVASARQFGVERATGDYAIHVDPDDWVDSDMLESLVTQAHASKADVVICDFFQELPGQSVLIKQCPSSLDAAIVARELFQQLHGSCCNKLIASAYYKSVSFVPGLNHSEDVLYNCKILQKNPVISYLPRAFYHYEVTDTSITKTYTADIFYQLNSVYGELLKLFVDDAITTEHILNHRAILLSALGTRVDKFNATDVTKIVGDVRGQIWKSTRLTRYRKLEIIAFLSGFRIISVCMRRFHNLVNQFRR